MKLIFLLICFVVAFATKAACAAQKVAMQGETLVAASAPNLAVQVKIKTHEVNIGKPSDPRPAVIESNCTYSRYPCSIVDRIDIVVNGKPLFVPRTTFCGLADLNSADLVVDGKGSLLTLLGGDASESYMVKIEFSATEVKRRILSSELEPNEPLEETVYHAVTIGD